MAVESAARSDNYRDVRTPRDLRRNRQRDHLLKLVSVDLLAAAAASLVVYLDHGRAEVYTLLPLLWPAALLAVRAYGHRQLTQAAADHGRIGKAALGLCGAAVIGSELVLGGQERLLHDAVAGLAAAALLTLLLRAVLRSRTLAHWAAGRHLRRVLVIGEPESVRAFADSLSRQGPHGLHLVGACVTEPGEPGLPVLGRTEDVPAAVRRTACEMVIALPGGELDHQALRGLGWALDGEGVQLLVSPMLADVAAERLSVQAVGGMPLVHVRAPVRSGHAARLPKEVLDRVLASVGLLMLTPLLLVLALLVRLSSPGPAFFRQRRVGLDGEPFTMLKFRTMLHNAESLRSELAELNLNTDGPLFKMRQDPRTTTVGRFLRRYSLDELPQLFNVLAGHMSLVGPRPPLPEETLDYDEVTRRRLLVKPGLTGLWQVSGRSDLPWHEAVRLDLSYVDNWSHSLDALILLRTTSAVARGKGAY
ncbi:exopolysaccharide biosynthesis polyprenyl glycosylphosphotransferase [Kitasatospora sp. MMS16-BH015]|uniref:sugar transferase n=1 Tax=Kitasatospora sp. MMS16-BH015 TaxID=2018025 RepID=UPI000CA0D9FA|nr:sugar transferase [Kitasatospora sp. MMS16-BH015]AUG76354.1 exopolysaccharide biosynthesis polyprenyl glycosylphosphotransferase [Kitasatospora sp. MMS16-BH015]